MSEPLRVLYVAHSVSADGGGMERVGRHLVQGLEGDVEFTVLASDGLDGLADSVATLRLRLPARPAFVRILWFYWRSGRIIRRYRAEFDVVHSCGAVTKEPVTFATVHLCHAAAVNVAIPSRRGWRRLNSALARRCGLFLERRQYRPDKVGELIAVSTGVERELEQSYPGVPRRVIANGVDLDAYRGVIRAEPRDRGR